jgi:uncharacterized protein (DUF697 family)/uncharacterized tellurite resistance protein B-like protein
MVNQVINPVESGKSSNPAEAIQSQLSEKLLGVFEQVVNSRSSYYESKPELIPTKESIPQLINAAATKNMAISGAASLVPGPWGMVAVVPEITVVIKHQIEMIYDIGTAYGHQKKLNQELLASVFAFALGSSGMGLLVMQGGKVLVKRASLRVFQRLVAMLAGKVTQRLLKSMISKWLPIVGAAAMATWSNMSTRQIGKQAVAIFEKDLYISDEEVSEDENLTYEYVDRTKDMTVPLNQSTVSKVGTAQSSMPIVDPISTSQASSSPNLDVLKIQVLIDLMKVDGNIDESEKDFLKPLIQGLACNKSDCLMLLEYMSGTKKMDINYQLLAESPDDSIGLMVDMVALAKRDGNLHVTEKMYIKKIGKMLNFDDEEIKEVMAA